MNNIKNIMLIVCVQILLLCSSAGAVSAEVLSTTFYHNDVLGSPVAATDEQGNIKWRENYHPYGDKVNNDIATVDNSRWYTSHPHDEATGLTYAGARYYDPVVGRFMGVDPDGNIPVDTAWDAVSIIYDVTKIGVGYALDNPRLIQEGGIDLAADTVALFIPYVPAGSTKITRMLGKGADDSFEILDGVRRTKAAEITDKKTINAGILVDNKVVGSKEIPIGLLLSPKKNISLTRQIDADRFMNTLNQTKSGSKPPNIQVVPGSKGTPIKDVGFE